MTTNDKIVAAVRRWQSSPTERLTCRRVSSHQALEPVIEDDQVVLRCLDCSYRQTFIPQIVIWAGADDRRL
jgi:hypothetical protein